MLVGAAVLCTAVGCRDERVDDLQQRVTHLERTVQQLQAERDSRTNGDDARRARLESCVAEANAEFQRSLVSNGTRAHNGSYKVPVPVLTEMQRQKQGKMDECQLLYGGR
jgi:outer membrane murein-binding lipoprotein Lpp